MVEIDEITEELRVMRRVHDETGLRRDQLEDDPFQQFGIWMQDAIDAGLELPNAMTVATADAAGRPSARVTLLKGFDEHGFVFYTNFESRKGQDLAANPYAALVFYWHDLGRQVRIEGPVERVPEEEAVDYFESRPLGSRIGAWASPQSRPIADRSELESLAHDAEARFNGSEVPKPPHWGGYLVVPERIEFWKGRPNRLHDRFVFERDGDGWKVGRIAP